MDKPGSATHLFPASLHQAFILVHLLVKWVLIRGLFGAVVHVSAALSQQFQQMWRCYFPFSVENE